MKYFASGSYPRRHFALWRQSRRMGAVAQHSSGRPKSGWIRRTVLRGEGGVHQNSNRGRCCLLGQDFSDAANLSADSAQLFFDVLVTAINVIYAIDDGFAIRDEGGKHQR